MEQIKAAEFAAKYKSKREIYSFLTVDAGAYLPAYDTVTIYFLKDMLSGVKKCKCYLLSNCFHIDVKCTQVSHLFVPQYEDLTIEKITAWLNDKEDCWSYYPI
jgi:hypothetical protein